MKYKVEAAKWAKRNLGKPAAKNLIHSNLKVGKEGLEFRPGFFTTIPEHLKEIVKEKLHYT